MTAFTVRILYLKVVHTLLTTLILLNGDTATPATTAKVRGEYLEWTPSGGLTFTTAVEVYVHMQHGTTTYNTDTPVTVPTLSGNEGWVTVKTGGGVINSIKVTGTADYAVVSAFRVDGVIFTDHPATPSWSRKRLTPPS